MPPSFLGNLKRSIVRLADPIGGKELDNVLQWTKDETKRKKDEANRQIKHDAKKKIDAENKAIRDEANRQAKREAKTIRDEVNRQAKRQAKLDADNNVVMNVETKPIPNNTPVEAKVSMDVSGGAITDIKSFDSLTRSIKNNVKLLSINIDNSFLYGSFNYKSNPYWGDIDIIELVNLDNDNSSQISSVAVKIRKIVENIKKIKNTYFADFKCGLDKRYVIDIGKVVNGYVVNFDHISVSNKIEELYNDDLISFTEYEEINAYITPHISYEDYSAINDILRNYYILRWSADEILKGYKILNNDVKYLFTDALKDKTMVKIDIWSYVDNKYVEITNYFVLQYIDDNGNTKFVNINDVDIIVSLKEEVFKYTTKMYYKPFKMVKRMFSIARLTGDNSMLKTLTPLIQSSSGALYQIVSEIDTVMNMIKHLNSPPMQTIFKQIDNFKYRISNITDIDINEKYLYKTIDDIISGDLTNDVVVEELEQMKYYLNDIINDNTISYLKEYRVYPPPPKYMSSANGGSIFSEAFDRVRAFLRGARTTAPPSVRKLIEKYGDYTITSLYVCRDPIISAIDSALNFLSFGKLSREKKKLAYDDLYHLYILAKLKKNGNIVTVLIEKNHVFNITLSNKIPKDYIIVDINKQLSFVDLINNGLNKQGSEFWFYHPTKNNCQVAVFNIIDGSNLMTDELKQFILQDAKNLLSKRTERIAGATTDLASRFDILLHGQGFVL